MGFIDSLRDRASSAVNQVKQGVSDAVHKVEDKAATVVDKVEQKAVEVGHDVKSAFESKALPKPPPSAPPPAAAPAGKSFNVGAALRNDLDKAIADQLKTPGPSSAAQQQAADMKAARTSWKGLDEEGLAHDMAELVKKDPAAAAPVINALMNGKLDRNDKDDVAQAFAHELSGDQLKALARHPDGAAALKTMEHELRTGWTTGDEAKMADAIKGAVSGAEKEPLPNTAVPNMAPGAQGVVTTDASKKTPSGAIPPAMWDDPSKLAAALTQNPATGTTDGNTCAASSMLASTLMASPEKAARFLENVGKSEHAKNLSVGERNELIGIADRVRNKTATFEDLNKAQQLLFKAGNTHGDSNTIARALNERGMITGRDGVKHIKNLTPAEETELRGILAKDTAWTDREVSRMTELTNRATGLSMRMEKVEGNWAPRIEGDLINMDPAGFSDAEAKKLASMGGLKSNTALDGASLRPSEIAARLQKGEAVSVRVAGNPNDSTDSDHFITIGRRDDGTLYLYNSDPAKGDASVVVGGKDGGTPEFRRVLGDYDARMLRDPNGQNPKPVPYRLD